MFLLKQQSKTMGSWPRSRYRQCSPHPYACALRLRRFAKAESQVRHLFADINYEIIDEDPGVVKDTGQWLIKESGEAYAFVVERRGLRYEEVEVFMEQQGLWGPDLEAEGSHRIIGSTLLSICCTLPPGGGGLAAAVEMAEQRVVQTWRFGRRFLLPSDVVPEGATAMHEDGVLTVHVPRQSSTLARNQTPLWWAAENTFGSSSCSQPGLGSQYGARRAYEGLITADSVRSPLDSCHSASGAVREHYDMRSGGSRSSDQIRPKSEPGSSLKEQILCRDSQVRPLEIKWIRTFASPGVFPAQQVRRHSDLMECS